MWKCYGKNSCGNNITNKEKSVVSVYYVFYFYFTFIISIFIWEFPSNSQQPTTIFHKQLESRKKKQEKLLQKLHLVWVQENCFVVAKVFPFLFPIFPLLLLYMFEEHLWYFWLCCILGKLRVCLHFWGLKEEGTTFLCWLLWKQFYVPNNN